MQLSIRQRKSAKKFVNFTAGTAKKNSSTTNIGLLIPRSVLLRGIFTFYLQKKKNLSDINNETNQIYIQGGIIGYGDYGILKVDSIVIITSMNGRTKRERPAEKEKKDKKKTFEHLLKEAREEMTGTFDMRA